MKYGYYIICCLTLILTGCIPDDSLSDSNNNSMVGNYSSGTIELVLDWNNLAYTVSYESETYGIKMPLVYAPNCSYVVYKKDDEQKLFAKLRGMGLTVNEEWVGGESYIWNVGRYKDTKRLFRIDDITPEELNKMDEVLYASRIGFYWDRIWPLYECIVVQPFQGRINQLNAIINMCHLEIYSQMGTEMYMLHLTKETPVNVRELENLFADNGIPRAQSMGPYGREWVHGPSLSPDFAILWGQDLYDWWLAEGNDRIPY